MKLTILTPTEMANVDRLAIERGPHDGIALMQRAGTAVAEAVMVRFPQAVHVDVLCGPGNNGGDGYVAATILARAGIGVSVWATGLPRSGSDAAAVAAECPIERRELADFRAQDGGVVIDALFGSGLARPLDAVARSVIEKVTAWAMPVVSVDLPSGLSGESGQVLGAAFRAAVTVTFVRKKPGHLLYPGRALCGELVERDIGINDSVVEEISSRTFENLPPLWLARFPRAAEDTYKYRRGHVGVFSGGLASTGAARLSAMAAARVGAGAVTLLLPPAALTGDAAHLTSPTGGFGIAGRQRFDRPEQRGNPDGQFVDGVGCRKVRLCIPHNAIVPHIRHTQSRAALRQSMVLRPSNLHFELDVLQCVQRSPQSWLLTEGPRGGAGAPRRRSTPSPGRIPQATCS